MSRITALVSLEFHVEAPHRILVRYQLFLVKSTHNGLYDGDVLKDATVGLSYESITHSLASPSKNCLHSHGGPVSLHKSFNYFEIRALNALLDVCKDPCLDIAADQETLIQYIIVSQLPITDVQSSKEDEASETQQSLICYLRDLESSAAQTCGKNDSLKGKELADHHLLSNQGCGYLQIEKHPIWREISEDFQALVEHVRLGLKAGHLPELAAEGSGGVYFMKDERGVQNVAVFKPMDEEPMSVNNPRGFCYSHAGSGEGLKKGTKVGEGAIREVAAYILDYPAAVATIHTRCKGIQRDEEGFAGVPPCAMVTCSYHEADTYKDDYYHGTSKRGSLQRFVDSFATCDEMGVSLLPVEEVQKITVLDMRLANTDRHAGNMLVCREKDGCLKLVPIDHGYCLPETFQDCTFEWLYWPQASQPYGPSALKYIEALDAEQDIELLQQCGWTLGPKCARVLRIATMVLKKGAAAGLMPFQIGSIMSCSKVTDNEPPIEALIHHAEALNCPPKTELSFLQSLGNLLDEHIARCIKERV